MVRRIATFIQRYFTYILFRTLFLVCFHLHFPLKHHILKNNIHCNVYKLDYKYNTVHVIQYWNINTLDKICVIYYVYRKRNNTHETKTKSKSNQIHQENQIRSRRVITALGNKWVTCIFYVNKSNPVPKKTIPSFWDAPTHWWDFKSPVLKRQPPRHEYNLKGSHHLNSIVILKVLELKSNMYAAIVVFFASIVGVNSLSIHKRSCSVTIDSDFAVNKVRHIFSYLFFF